MQTSTRQSPVEGQGSSFYPAQRGCGHSNVATTLSRREPYKMEGTLRTALFMVIAASANAIYIKGTIITDSTNHVLIAKYCFAYSQSLFEYDITYPFVYRVQKLLLATESEWGMGDYDCNTLASQVRPEQTIELTPENPSSGCQSKYMNNELFYQCTNKMTFVSDVPRKWHIVLARCGWPQEGRNGLWLNYTMHMANGVMEDEAYGCIDDMVMSAGVSAHTAQWTAAFILAATTVFKLLFSMRLHLYSLMKCSAVL